MRKCPPGWGTLGQVGVPKPLPCLMGAKGPNPLRDPAGCQFGITRTLPWVKEPEAAEVPPQLLGAVHPDASLGGSSLADTGL